MTAAPENFQKWALVVGVDRYEHLDPRYHLEGCVNDAKAMAGLLQSQFQFPAENITLLLDEQATQAAILDAMRGLARSKVGKDDVVVFHYSGHGSQRTDGPEMDEDDGRDETILAYDAQRGGPDSEEPNFDISDDDIHAWLQEVTKKTPYVTLIFDCCHSGTVAREGPGALHPLVRVRWVQPDLRSYTKMRPALYSPSVSRGAPEGRRSSGASGWLPEDRSYTLLAGCLSRERSFEVRLHEGEVEAHGAFTFHLLQALRDAASDESSRKSYRDVFERVAARVTADFPDQHPQLEGARERQLFGPLHLEPMRFVGVRAREGEVVTLEAGAACGMSHGALWAIYPQGTRDPEKTAPLGRVEVRSAQAVTSEAVVVEEAVPGTIGPGCRAVELIHDFNKHLAVSVEGFEAAAKSIELVEKEIQRSLLLRLVRGRDAAPQIRVELIPPKGPINPKYPVDGAVWRALSADNGDLVLPEVRASDHDAYSRLVGNLEKKARYDNVLKLKNPNGSLEGKVEMILFRQRGDDWVEMPRGETVLADGERVAVEVRNHHDRDLYVQILDLGVLKGIDLLHPIEGGCEAVPAGKSFQIGFRLGDEIVLGVPKEFPFNRNGSSPVSGVEVLRLFATTHATDLAPLLQPRIRDLTTADTTLTALFGAAAGKVRVHREFFRKRGQEDWTVVERAITVVR